MTEFERKVLEYLEWKKGLLSRPTRSDVILYLLLGGAILLACLTEVLPLFLG